MSIFKSAKIVTFASKLLTVAGFDLEKLFAAGDENALKSAMSAAAKPDEASESILKEASKENEILSGRIATTEAALKVSDAKISSQGAIIAAYETLGTKAEVNDKGVVNTEKLKKDDDLRVAAAASKVLAKAGHPPIPDTRVEDPTKAKKAIDPALTGLARTTAVFKAAMDRGQGAN